jgi:hypothetical protein
MTFGLTAGVSMFRWQTENDVWKNMSTNDNMKRNAPQGRWGHSAVIIGTHFSLVLSLS